MDSIINKLTEIESAASAIVQHAEVEKSALDESGWISTKSLKPIRSGRFRKFVTNWKRRPHGSYPGKVRRVRMNLMPCRRNTMKSILIMLMRFSDGSLRCSLWEIYWNTVVL